jgi:predicted nucleic acid-binding protein
VTAVLDTSVVVRYFVHEQGSPAARRAVESGEPLYIPLLVISEAAHVLRSVYRLPREQVVDTLLLFLERDGIEVLDAPTDLVREALLLARPSGRVSIEDSLIWAAARAAGRGTIVHSFDLRFPSHEVELRLPQ